MKDYRVYAYDNENGLIIQYRDKMSNMEAFNYFDLLSFHSIGLNVTIQMFKGKNELLTEVKGAY